MPFYDYRCNGCGDTFEEYQSFNDDKLIKCKKCKKNKLERLIGCPFFFVQHDPKTLEHQADRNSKKFGYQECQERELKAQERVDKTKKAVGKASKKKATESPWWRDGSVAGMVKSDKPLNEKQTKKYAKDIGKLGCTINESAVPPKKVKKNGSK
jgi:putative FmdB family regulatory protein